LDSQSKFDEASNKLIKILRNIGIFFNDLSGNESLALPHSLWFGILDLIRQSSKQSTYGHYCYLVI